MTARDDLARSVYQAEQDIDRLYAPLPAQIGASVRKHAVDGKITQEARMAVLSDVDAMLDTIYPKRRGGPSRLQAMIERRANLARMLPIEAAVATMQDTLPGDVLAAMGRGGK